MPKKKTAKPARKPTPKKKTTGTPAPVDPIQAALARRRAALIGR